MPDDRATEAGSNSHEMQAAGSSIQAEATMIASNIDPRERTAPNVTKVSIIDDIYAFAAHLQAGSTGQ